MHVNSSDPHQLTQPATAESPARSRTEQTEGPIRAATHEVNHLHELERAGESEWTPWIAIAGLILFFAAIGLVMYTIVEAAAHLLASTSIQNWL